VLITKSLERTKINSICIFATANERRPMVDYSTNKLVFTHYTDGDVLLFDRSMNRPTALQTCVCCGPTLRGSCHGRCWFQAVWRV